MKVFSDPSFPMDLHVLKKSAFLLLLAGCAIPSIHTATALATGILFALLFGNPFTAETARWSKRLLQLSVVGLGFGLDLSDVLTVGRGSFSYTIIGITATIAAGTVLGSLCGTSRNTSLLVSFGTAICGGSAIAALAPVLGAESEEVAVSLATIFTLNSVALLLFPLLGHLFGMSQHGFGLWAGLAIHDTSSVVGAAAAYGTAALAVGTTVKLTRAIWISPCIMIASWIKKSDKKASIPLFIVGFLAAAALRSALPQMGNTWGALSAIARQCLVVTLFLVGSGLSRNVLRNVGLRPLVQGTTLWLLVSGVTLVAILNGWIT